MKLWPTTIRGLVLWLFGWAFIVVGGINYVGTTIPEPSRTYLAAALNHAPALAYGCLFIAVGLTCVATGYSRSNLDQWGYLFGAVLAAAWATVYVCGFLFYDAPLRSLGGSVVYLLYAAILTTCARIPNVTGDDLRAATQ